MKKFLFFTLFIFFAMTSLEAQSVTVPQTQVPVVMKVTASWCPFCGGWGWDFMENLYSDNEGDAVMMAVHYSGEHTSEAASDIATNIGAFSQPRFFLDGADQNVSSGTASAKRTEMATKIQNIISMSPDIQTGIQASYYMEDLNISYSVKAFNDLDGDYYVSLYLADKVHVGYQSGIGNNANHKNLIREEATGNTFGTMVFSGSTTSGSFYDGSVSLPLMGYDPANLEVISIIWRKQGNEYQIINSNIDDEIEEQITSSTSTVEGDKNLLVFPTIVDQSFTVDLSNSNVELGSILLLTDLNGRTLTRKIHVDEQNQEILVERGNIASGIYLASLISGNEIYSTKIIFE